ncbi:Transcription initiation factor TFIID subunit 2 [Tolypocladium ophioglossoides CBS 100239]|uniref:Transcription initiation factor TFIID subunit 2 n=1 Tax=Tolypocladium ophioglossoides (strain CBS 100239) TaxID=1163406 RepID=A0A0L0NBF2_TOLOC|nr:Transcription initiation factor TFIID subunit 2 [Tolypocladium ophioglossoides CBS 100239]
MALQPGADQHPLLDGGDDLPPIEDKPIHEYFIVKQEVNLEVNFCDRRIHGTTDIYIVTFNERVEEIAIDAAHCDIDTDNVTVTEMREAQGEVIEGQTRKGQAVYLDPYKKLSHPKGWNWTADHHDLRRIRARSIFHNRRTDASAENRELEGCTPVYGSLKVLLRGKGEQDRPRLIIRKPTSNLDAVDRIHKQYRIRVPFSNKSPRDGLHFVGVDPLDNRFTHMYTRHSIQPGTASCIFPCIDDHGARCDWRISIKYPRTLGDALQQALVTQKDAVPNGSDKMQIDGQDKALKLAEEDKLREMTVVCSGFLMEETVDPYDDHKKIMTFEPEKKVSVQKLGFAVGPFEHIDMSSEFRTEEDEVKLGMSALKVHAYCLPNRGDWVRNTAAALTMAADFLTYTFAKYPFGNFKVCFLDDMIEYTVPLHSLSFVSNRLLFPDDIIDTEIDVTRKIVFTLTYQWIGINMIPNTRNDLWLVLGVAHYMTDLFMKKICGNNEHRFRMKIMADKLVQVDVDRPSLWDLGPNLHLGESEMDFMALKAPVVFFILDKRMIKASGGHGLTRILQKFLTKAQIESSDKSTILDTEKFRLTCEKGLRYRLETFWNQWVYGSGCPRFDVKAKFNKKRLCVELTLNQVQHQVAKKPEIDKGDFLRAIKERRADMKIGDVQSLFTGPMTIRIHEADGTPYEHILEIREDATRSTKFEIPYNTKYKRLKRTRRLKEKHNVGASLDIAENADDALLYCLGDVLQGPDDLRDWELIEWDPETERKMDQESYKWIRIDADFEWACDMKRTLEPYMYVSQLQQDRDVVAQQDAMLYLANGPLHPIASGFLVRTLVDRRYFHGIRTMAAQALPRQANIKDIPMLGLRQRMRAFREMFCYEQTNQPYPNDFSDKKQYNVRIAVIKAISEVRDHTYRCPLEARRFILDQLLFNNNEDNAYSDHFYIGTLVGALATALIPSRQDDWLARQKKAPNEEERRFLDEALEQIERVLRRDEWTNSYQNTWTIAGLDAKQRLMKAEVIPKQYSDFAQYLLDGTRDLIRIKAFEALIDLGAMMDPTFFTFFLYSLTTDRSPYVRTKLIQAMARGLAAIAFGEHTRIVKNEPAPDEADPLLLVQDSAQEIEARKEMFARKENLDAALKALRKEMDETYANDERHYSTAMRKALDHPDLGREEVESLLDLAAMMFEEARSWILTLNLPKGWRVERPAQKLSDRLIIQFKSYYKINPKGAISSPPLPEPKKPAPLPRTSSIKISTKAATPQRSVGAAPNGTDTIVSLPSVSQPPSVATASAPRAPETPSVSSAKRARTEKEDNGSPAPKRPKTESQPLSVEGDKGGKVWKKRRMVTLRTNNPKRLAIILGQPLDAAPSVRTALPSGASKEPSPGSFRDSITAKPARKPLPTGDAVRKPLPNGGSGVSASPPAPQPPPKMSVDTSAAPVPASMAGSPPAGTPVSARPKIKIKIKQKPAPQPPPPA